MHFDLDLHLRTPGRLMLLERAACQTLLDRTLEGRPARSGWLGRLLGSTRPAASGDDKDRGETLAMPPIRWASDVEYANGYALVEGIAIIDVEGVMTPEGYFDWWSESFVPGYAQIGEALDAALADTRVRAVLLRVNSPGGLVDGCFDLAARIRAGSKIKPIWAHCRMACSAAYALASGASRILAPAEADIGSIGVLIMHYDFTQMYAEWGIKVEAIQSGARKTDGADWKPLSDDARTHLVSVVGQVAKSFVGTVVAGRGLTEDAVRAQEARWFLAQHDDPAQSALGLGLVDEIANERVAFAALIQSLSDNAAPGAPDGEGSTARAEHQEESDMALKDTIAALRAKASKGDKSAEAELKKFGISVTAGDSEAEAEGEDKDTSGAGDEEDDEDDDAAEAAADDGEGDEEGDDDKEPEAKATGSNAGFALLGCAEAKGRDGLAKELGRKVAAKTMTYGEAKRLLGSAPKASRLGDAMAGRDRNPGRDGSAAKGGLGAAVDRLNVKRQQK